MTFLRRHSHRRGSVRPRTFLRRSAFLLSIVLSTGLASPAAFAQVWLGLGYDGVSQEYFLTVIDTALLTPDSLEQLKRTATAINEGEMSLRTRIGNNISWDQTTAYSSLYWQHRSYVAAYTPRNRSIWGGVEYRLNYKTPHDSAAASAFSNYITHEVQGRFQKHVAGFGLGLRGIGQFVRYPDSQAFTYDYDQYRAEARFTRGSDPIHYQELGILLLRRNVPDSARVSYREAGLNLGVGWGVGIWRTDAVVEFVNRRYDTPEAGLGFNAFRLRMNWNDDGIQAHWPGLLEIESYSYDNLVSLLADFVRADLRQRRAFPLPGGWSPFVEPGLEYVWSAADEDYVEPRLKVGTELFRLDGWWASSDVGLGRRNYPSDSFSGFSSFWRFNVNVFVNGPLTRRLALNVMYTQDWEWHAVSADNLSVLILSAGLRYRI